MTSEISCATCEDIGWVCECHGDRAWGGATDSLLSCDKGPGRPCPQCNASDGRGQVPRMPPSVVTVAHLKGGEK